MRPGIYLTIAPGAQLEASKLNAWRKAKRFEVIAFQGRERFLQTTRCCRVFT